MVETPTPYPIPVCHPDPLLAAAGSISGAIDTVQPSGTWARADVADRAPQAAADFPDLHIELAGYAADDFFIFQALPVYAVVILDDIAVELAVREAAVYLRGDLAPGLIMGVVFRSAAAASGIA